MCCCVHILVWVVKFWFPASTLKEKIAIQVANWTYNPSLQRTMLQSHFQRSEIRCSHFHAIIAQNSYNECIIWGFLCLFQLHIMQQTIGKVCILQVVSCGFLGGGIICHHHVKTLIHYFETLVMIYKTALLYRPERSQSTSSLS